VATKAASTLCPEDDLRILEDRFSIFRSEASLASDAHWVLGLDEVGRGCLAGPVCAAAFAYRITSDRMHWKPAYRVTDSKKLSAAQRRQAEAYVLSNPEFVSSVCEASVEEIDSMNILRASMLAMSRAYETARKLIPESAHVWTLVDGNVLPELSRCESASVVQGDSKSFAIAVAAILAKEHRDTLMRTLSEKYPLYNWASNVGYPTTDHATALRRIGISPWHRKSFRLGGKLLHEICEVPAHAESSSDPGQDF
jgi:ribonuclease HII